MEPLLQHFNQTDQLWDECTLSNSAFIDVSSIWTDFAEERVISHNTIPNNNVLDWLDQQSRTDAEGHRLTQSFRVVWAEYDNNERRKQIASKPLERILEQFSLNVAYGYYTTVFAGAFCIPPSNPEDLVYSFTFSYHPKFAMIWSYDPSTNLTSAICFAQRAQIEQAKTLMTKLWTPEVPPYMFPALMCAVLLSCEIDHTQDSIKRELRSVEKRTGYHQWSNRKESAATGDLARLGAMMGGCATRAGSVTRKNLVVSQLCLFMLDRSNQPDLSQLSERPRVEDPEYQNSRSLTWVYQEGRSKALHRSVALIQQRTKMQQLDTDFFQHRVDIQTKALTTLLSQNDAQLQHVVTRDTKLIATASQRDSLSMKILAVVTMFFLPGTFVAGLFSFQLVDFNNTNIQGFASNQGQTASHSSGDLQPRFWMYWVIAIPLTTLTVLICATWYIVQRRRYSRENQAMLRVVDTGVNLGDISNESEIEALILKRRNTGVANAT